MMIIMDDLTRDEELSPGKVDVMLPPDVGVGGLGRHLVQGAGDTAVVVMAGLTAYLLVKHRGYFSLLRTPGNTLFVHRAKP